MEMCNGNLFRSDGAGAAAESRPVRDDDARLQAQYLAPFQHWLQFNCSMTFDVLGQRLYGPPLRVTHNIPVLLKSSSSVAMTQLASFERRWHCHISRAAAALRRLLLPCPRIDRTPDVKDLRVKSRSDTFSPNISPARNPVIPRTANIVEYGSFVAATIFPTCSASKNRTSRLMLRLEEQYRRAKPHEPTR